ncbi:hypothetical protein NDK50_25290 [Paraburkholderia bryophila]|uniref:hypothetical protein n=1 Tax=Paraburkholderia bryophila TaxID=420952 RepID=UPI00234A599D|nr:hypothetical protein [Paraburkholderia bryophila]WCM24149.1 hypothetical protein NDK50_25290 [Paraburkholderia bryophila]
MRPTKVDTLSSLIEQKARPDPEASLESAADACLVQRKFGDALLGYYQLDTSIPRIATKVAYCEWMVGQWAAARDRLLTIVGELEADGIGLFCELVEQDGDYKRRAEDLEAVWPFLKEVIASDQVPLITAIARATRWWPGDLEQPELRQQDLARLLAHHPGSQHLRLSLLGVMARVGVAAAEQYELIHSWPYSSPMPRYLWASARVASEAGEYGEALECLEHLEEGERRSENPSSSLLLEIDLARSEVLAVGQFPDAISNIDRLLENISLNSDEKARVARVALAAACSVAPERVSALADNYLAALENKEYGFSISHTEFTDEIFPIHGEDWDTYGESWSCADLTAWRSVLVDVGGERARLFFRAAFCVDEIDAVYEDADDAFSPDTEWWDSLAEMLGDLSGYREEFGGRLLSLDAAIRANRHRPNWSKAGQDWIASELFAKNNEQDTHGWLTLRAVRRSGSTSRTFAKGVVKQLRELSLSPPLAYDLVVELIRILVEKQFNTELYALMQTVAEGDNRPDVQFYLGLATSWTNRDVEARSAYTRVLEKQPKNHPAIFNALLLCKTHTDKPFLDLLETLVEQYPDEEQEEKQELSAALANARQRCVDKDALKREVIREELSKYPKLEENEVSPEDISLRAAVAILALFRCSKAEPGDEVLPPFGGSDVPFSPTAGGVRILFDLMKTGLIAVDSQTSIEAFEVKDGKLSNWFMGRIRWRMSPAVGWLIEQIRSLRGEIPESWRREIEPLAVEIARGEIAEYLNLLAEERGWPEPGNTEDVSDLTRALVSEVSVAQAFYLAYLGAMSASDYKQKYPVNRQQAADMLIRRTGQRLESMREAKPADRSFSRPWKLPRSGVSMALWGTILDKGDYGFNQKITNAVAGLESEDS